MSYPTPARGVRLVVLAAQKVAANPHLILRDPDVLQRMPEEVVALLLAMLVKCLRLTAPLAAAFSRSGHERVVTAVASLDVFRGLNTMPATACRPL